MAGGDGGEGKDSPSPTEHMFLLLSSQIQTDVVDTTTSQNNIKIRGAATFLAQNDVQHLTGGPVQYCLDVGRWTK